MANSEKIAITRHGRREAMLAPTPQAGRTLSHKEIVKGMRELRRRVKPGKMSVREMIGEGRRF